MSHMEYETEYGVWRISYDRPPVPFRDMDWSAAHDEYEGSIEDGVVRDNELLVHAATYEDLIVEIDCFDWEGWEDTYGVSFKKEPTK